MNVLTTAASGSILFDSGTAGGSTHTHLSAAAELSYDGTGGIDITSHVPGETDRFNVRGAGGTLFSVNDALTGTVFSVNDASGLPIIEVNSDAITDTIAIGEYGTNALFVSAGNVGIGTTSPGQKLDVAGNIAFGDSHLIGDDGDDNLLIQGSAGENIIIDSADDIILDADGGEVVLKDGGTSYGHLKGSTSDFIIQSLVSDKDIIFKGNDGGNVVTALTLDISDAGTATFNHNVNLPDGGQLNIGANADLYLTHDDNNGYFYNNKGDLFIDQTASDSDIVFKGTDGGADITALRLDMSDGGAADFGGDINLGTGKNIYMSGTSGLRFLHDGTNGNVINGTGDFNITNGASDKDIKFKGNDGGSSFTALTLDMSDAGAASFNNWVCVPTGSLKIGGTAVTSTATELNLLDGFSSIPGACCTGNVTTNTAQTITGTKNFCGDICVGSKIIHTGDSDTYFQFGNNVAYIVAGNETVLAANASGVVINEPGNSNDFRVESNTDTYALFVDGSADKVGIGTANPSKKLHVAGDGLFTSGLTVQGDLTVTGDFTCLETTVSLTSAMDITNTGTGPALVVNQTGSNDIVNFKDDGTSAFYIEDGGNVGIGTTNPDTGLHLTGSSNSTSGFTIENTSGGTSKKFGFQPQYNDDRLDIWYNSNSNAAITIKDGGNVGIADTNPAHALDVNGNINTLGAYYMDDAIVINNTKCFVGAQVRPTTAIADAYISSAVAWNACATTAQGTKADDALPKSGGTMSGHLNMDNYNICNVNTILFNDPGPSEGLTWSGGNTKIFESPDNLTTNSAGNLQMVYGSTRRLTVNNTGIDVNGNINATGTYKMDGTDIISTSCVFQGAGVDMGDNHCIKLGVGDDLVIKHNSLDSYVENYTGDLHLANYADDKDIIFHSDNGSGGITEYLRLDGSGVITRFKKNTVHEDNVKGLFGNSSDLQIYHDGTNSYIADTGTGDLRLNSDSVVRIRKHDNETMANFTANGSVDLYYDNIARLCTTAGGVNINGGMYLVNDLTVNGGDITLGGTGRIQGIDTVSSGTDAANKTYVDTKLALAGGTMTGNIVMGDHDITGIDFLQFTSGTYLTDVSSNYVKLNYASSGAGGIIVYDGDSALQGYLYADGASTPSFGLLTGAGQWGVRTVRNGLVELRHDNAIKLLTTSTGICVCGDLTVSGGDITLGGTGRIQGIDTVSSGTDATNKTYVDTCLAGKLSTSGCAANSALLDSIDSSQFLRSDTADTLAAVLEVDEGTGGNIVYDLADNGVYIPKPIGADYASTANAHTGAIAIKLPTTAWIVDDMLSFHVDIYDYAGGNEGESVTLHIYGYTYTQAAPWHNVGAVVVSDRSDRDYNVRFGQDGTRFIVYIGETNSTWNYLQVNVRDFHAGFGANHGNYDSGWDVVPNTTSFQNVTMTSSNNYPYARSLKGLTSTVTELNYSDGVTSNIQNQLNAKQVSGTYNTIIGTDSDVNTSGATIIDCLTMTDGVIQGHATRTLTLANLGYTGATNATSCTGDITAVVAGTGMTGGATSGSATVNVIGGDGITANADNIVVDSTVVRTSGNQSIAGVKTFSSQIDADAGIDVFTGGITGSNYNITGVNQLSINDPGEGIYFGGGTNNVHLFAIDDTADNIMNFHGASELRVNNSKVWTAGNDGSGSGLDADTTDGLHVHNTQSTQNSPNAILRTQANGYTKLGWIETTSGNNNTAGITRIYASSDSYIRYYTPANFGAQIGSHISYNDLTNKPTIPTNNNQLTNGNGYTTCTGNLCGSTAQCIFDSVYNFCIGPNAGEDFTSGSNNTLIGKCAGRCITTGAHNVSIGSRAGEKNCVKSYNVSLGYQAGFCGQGCGSTAIGQAALQNASSDNSVAIGKCTLYAASGNSNTAIGAQALQNMTSGQNNFGLGAIAGFALQTGNGNVFIGQDASRYQTSGDNVVAIGKRAGRCHSGGTRTVGNNNIYIGQDTKSSANSTSNEIVIGCGAVGCGSNKAMIGNSSVTVVCSNGSFSTVSDRRDKTCICDLEFGLDFIGNLKPKTFNMITDRSDPEGSISCKRHGFIAQDVIALEGDDPVITNNDNPDRLGYTGEHIIPILVKGMQEQQAIIDNLTARLEALEG